MRRIEGNLSPARSVELPVINLKSRDTQTGIPKNAITDGTWQEKGRQLAAEIGLRSLKKGRRSRCLAAGEHSRERCPGRAHLRADNSNKSFLNVALRIPVRGNTFN